MTQFKLDKNEKIALFSLGMTPEDQVKPRADKDGNPKLSPAGKPTYPTRIPVIRADGYGQEKGTTIAVEHYEAFPSGTALQTSGDTYITPYVADGRTLGISVICERLVPVTTDKN